MGSQLMHAGVSFYSKLWHMHGDLPPSTPTITITHPQWLAALGVSVLRPLHDALGWRKGAAARGWQTGHPPIVPPERCE